MALLKCIRCGGVAYGQQNGSEHTVACFDCAFYIHLRSEGLEEAYEFASQPFFNECGQLVAEDIQKPRQIQLPNYWGFRLDPVDPN